MYEKETVDTGYCKIPLRSGTGKRYAVSACRFAEIWQCVVVAGAAVYSSAYCGTSYAEKISGSATEAVKCKEKEEEQKSIVTISGLQFLACFVLASLDFRFGWSHFPAWLTAAAVILFLTGYGLYAEVLRENAYLARTIEVQENQKLIDTGLYAIVRHPMYFATVLLFWAMPLVLGSWPASLVMLPYPLLLVKRIINEEQVLSNGLTGYLDYKKKV